MTFESDTLHPSRSPAIGIGTGANTRLVDPGAARALAVAAEELGYSSVWTFDSPAGEHWRERRPGRDVDEVLATLETLVASTSAIRVGVGLLRAPWPLNASVVDRLAVARSDSAGRVVLARPSSVPVDSPRVGRLLQMWSTGERELASGANGWMFETWDSWAAPVTTDGMQETIVARLHISDGLDDRIAAIRRLLASGVSEIVLDVIVDEGIDHALALYSRIAEAVESGLGVSTA